jgi:hypothetical protein
MDTVNYDCNYEVGSLTYINPDQGNVYTNVLLIDRDVLDYQVFVDAVNSSTFPIVYSRSSSQDKLITLLRKHFVEIHRIGICFASTLEGPSQLFFENMAYSSNENNGFISNIITEFRVKNIDYLACNTLQSSEWSSYYNMLSQSTGVIVGASDDVTGNLKYGGDWIMESTSEDVSSVYFNQNIEYYKYLLDGVYDGPNNLVTPIPGRVLMIKGADSKLYKLEINNYYKGGVTPLTTASSAIKLSTQRYYNFRFKAL